MGTPLQTWGAPTPRPWQVQVLLNRLLSELQNEFTLKPCLSHQNIPISLRPTQQTVQLCRPSDTTCVGCPSANPK